MNTHRIHTNLSSTPWGWRLTAIAGLIPAVAGIVGLLLSLISMTSGHGQPWLSLMGRHAFTADEIGQWNPELLSLWKLVLHIGGANLAATGATITWLSWSGLRKGHDWVRPLIWFSLVWTGGNDTIALLQFRADTGHGVPVALFTVLLGTVGLVLSRRR